MNGMLRLRAFRHGLLRALLIVLPVLLCVRLPAVERAHQLLWPATHTALKTLLPGFAVQSLDVRRTGAHWVVHAELANVQYVVTRGHAVAPGGRVNASTSARQVLLWALAPFIAAGALLPHDWKRQLAVLCAAGLLGSVLYGLFLPVVLAGTIWSLISPDQANAPSLEGLLIQVSVAAVHGIGYAVLAAWAATLVALRAQQCQAATRG